MEYENRIRLMSTDEKYQDIYFNGQNFNFPEFYNTSLISEIEFKVCNEIPKQGFWWSTKINLIDLPVIKKVGKSAFNPGEQLERVILGSENNPIYNYECGDNLLDSLENCFNIKYFTIYLTQNDDEYEIISKKVINFYSKRDTISNFELYIDGEKYNYQPAQLIAENPKKEDTVKQNTTNTNSNSSISFIPTIL